MPQLHELHRTERMIQHSWTQREKGDEVTQKGDGVERQRPSPVKINAEGPHRAQKKVVIKTSRKIGQGLNQEGTRDGTGERLRLGNKLRYIREAGV